MLDARMQTKLLLLRTQGPLCPLCGLRPVSDLHEIIHIRGIQKVSKYDLAGDYGLAVYAPGNCLLLCGYCNCNWANSKPVSDMLKIKMGLPGVDPENVAESARNIAKFSKIPRQHVPESIEYMGKTYKIL